MTTAHVNGKCRRCLFRMAHGLRQPMPEDVKAKLRALEDFRKGRRATDPRVEG